MSLTVAALDELAEKHAVADYPADGLKVEKIAALEAAGVDLEPEQIYRLRLMEDVEGQVASFMAGGDAVELSAENPVFETSDRQIFAGARDLPFLEEVDG